MMAKIAGKEEFEGENSQLCYIRESTGIKTERTRLDDDGEFCHLNFYQNKEKE